MSALQEIERHRSVEPATRTTATHFWFPVGPHWCSAFWHEGVRRDDTWDTVAVLCPSLMLEQARGHRQQRVMGRMLAAAGVPALRMSYQGTDNSSGHASIDGDDRSLLPAWREAIVRAIMLARRRAGATRVVVIARRMGALIALGALRDNAALLGDVELVLWDPPMSGAQFLREIHLRNELRSEEGPNVADAYADALASRVTIERSFVFSQETIDDLRRVTLDRPPPPSLHTHVIVPRAFRQISRALQKWPATDHTVFTLPDALLDLENWEGPQLPVHTMQAILDVVVDRPNFSGHHSYQPVLDSAHETVQPLEESWRGCAQALELPSLGIREEWVKIPSAGSSLVAVMTRPTGATRKFARVKETVPRTKVLLILSAGVDATPGEGDSNVRFARNVAASGIPVVRLDFRGIGESSAQSRAFENMSYRDGRTRDVADCVRFIRNRFLGATIVAMGLCSGAYWAIHAAARHIPIDEVVGVNPQLYAMVPLPPRIRSAENLGKSLMAAAAVSDGAKWGKLMSGHYSPSLIAQAAFGAVTLATGMVVTQPDSRTFANGMPRLNLEGLFPASSRFHLVFSADDLGYSHLMQHGLARLRKLKKTRQLQVHQMPHANHTFSTPSMRRTLKAFAMKLLEG
jgi:predicted alpha/beta hydrolase